MTPRQRETLPPVTLGQIRGHGCRNLLVYCGSLWCNHSAVMNADGLPDEIPVRSLRPRMVCTACGLIGAHVRPDGSPHTNRRTLQSALCAGLHRPVLGSRPENIWSAFSLQRRSSARRLGASRLWGLGALLTPTERASRPRPCRCLRPQTPRLRAAGEPIEPAIPATEFQSEITKLAQHGRVLVLLDACRSAGLIGALPAADVLKSVLAASKVTVMTSSTADKLSREDEKGSMAHSPRYCSTPCLARLTTSMRIITG
jgi:hypothetical protein